MDWNSWNRCCRAPYPSLFLVVSHASFRECHTADADGQRDCDWAFAEHLDHLHLRSAHEPRSAAFPASIRHAKHLSAHPPLIVALDAPLRSAPLRIPRQETHEHALAKTLGAVSISQERGLLKVLFLRVEFLNMDAESSPILLFLKTFLLFAAAALAAAYTRNCLAPRRHRRGRRAAVPARTTSESL